jgi:NAD(P)-dependent dehydrogenase (short-subunit alcohol dehydrogenase family)
MENKLRTFKDAVVIITGGASGIGKALAEELAGRGAVTIIADLQIDLAREVAVDINSRGGRASSFVLDVTDAGEVKKLIEEVYRKHGRLDYIFNNAGIAIFGEAIQYSHEDWEKVLNVNLHGVVHGVEAAYPIMVKQGFGHIVNTASMASLVIVPYLISYVATKYAVLGLSKTLRVEARPYGVKVSVVCPGVIRTPIMEGGRFGKMLVHISEKIRTKMERYFRPMAPDVFAKKVINKIARNKGIIIVPSWWRIAWWIERFSEPLAFSLAHPQHCDSRRMLDDAGKEKH